MQNLRLAPEEEGDDLYAGFELNEGLWNELDDDAGLQKAIQTSYGQRPPVAGVRGPMGGVAARMQTRGGRLMTGMASDGPAQPRPMSSVRGAGYSQRASQGGLMESPRRGLAKGPAPPLEVKQEDSPEDVIQQMEAKVNLLVEESAIASAEGNYQMALDKAKEAGRKERLLCRQREQAGLSDQISLDLTYCVLFNLANQYQVNRMHTEALNTYLLIVKNKMFSNGARLRLNMGNIYFEQHKYPLAIKMYRMALDQIQNAHSLLRLKILRNIGAVFVKMGQYSDAISTYEHIMSERGDFKTGLNLMLCYCALRDREKLKTGFKRLLTIDVPGEEDERYMFTDEEDPQQRLLLEIIRDDSLRRHEREQRDAAEYCILTAAKLMAPLIEGNFAAGFDWCIECVRGSAYAELASELEIAKAATFLKEKEFQKAVETLKDIERKGSKMASAAATNLSFIYFLEGDSALAERYADKAVEKDKYNPYAMVNKGNTLFATQQFEKAKVFYQEALSVEASCTEALFNLGLVHKRMSRMSEALDCFTKLHTIVPGTPQLVYHIADCYDKLDDFNQATDWFMQLLSLIPTDPKALQQMGEMFDSDNDRMQAYHYYSESFRYDPSSIDVISWLGAYFMESQFCDKAVHYFDRAAHIQPGEINWQMMVASCHRKTGNYQCALETYRKVHERFPDNLECLKFLIRLCTDLGLAKEAQDYAVKLKKVEKREASGGNSRSGGSRRGSNRMGSGSARVTSAGSDGISSGSSGPNSAKRREADSAYSDPLGDMPQRPKTSSRPRQGDDVDFNDVELGDDLLPV